MAASKEEIFNAADKLLSEGQKPTLEAVRKVTGGSYTTISPILNEWKAKQAEAEFKRREPVPQSVADKSNGFLTDLWAMALELANARLSSEREALNEERVKLEAERDEAITLADKLNIEVEEYKKERESLTKQNEQVRQEASGLTQQVAKLDDKLQEALSQNKGLQESLATLQKEGYANQSRVKELEKIQPQLVADKDKALRAESNAREDAARLSGQVEALQTQLADLMQRISPK